MLSLIGLAVSLMMLSAAVPAADVGLGTTVPPGAKSGDLTLEPCEVYLEGDDAHYPGDCGTLIVPENRKAPTTRLIALPVYRVKATGDDPLEPIFWFEGGPGGPNRMAYPSDGILERHDLIMVGYRGIDGQVALTCPEIGDAIRAIDSDFLSDNALAGYGRGAARCSKRILAEGIDLDGYSMNQTIEDMEAARIALGYERINLFGNSYGTRVEMLYQWSHPASIHRVVMVAVNPPGHFIWEPATIEQQLGQYAALCAEDAYCSSRTSDLMATMRKVSRDMPAHWLGISIDPDAIRIVTFMSLMESMQVPGSPVPLNGPAAIDLWLDAAEGDASGMALATLAAPLFLPALAERGHFLAMGGSAPDYLDPQRNYGEELRRQDTIIGAPWSRFVWGMVNGWAASSDQSISEIPDSNIETLLVGGSIDFSTPVQFARDELLPHLSRGRQVILRDLGHTETIWNSQPEARARLLNTFFDSGQVDDSLYRYQAPVFDVDKSWGGLARTLLAVTLLVIGIGLMLIVIIGRKLYRKAARGSLNTT